MSSATKKECDGCTRPIDIGRDRDDLLDEFSISQSQVGSLFEDTQIKQKKKK